MHSFGSVTFSLISFTCITRWPINSPFLYKLLCTRCDVHVLSVIHLQPNEIQIKCPVEKECNATSNCK